MPATIHPVDGGVPVHSWAPDLEASALEQAINCARLPVAHNRVCVMADGHMGYGVPIGGVIALRGAISPYAVGNDIGCGMGLVPTGLDAVALTSPLPGERTHGRDRLFPLVMELIPSGMSAHANPSGLPAPIDAAIRTAWEAILDASARCGVPISATETFKAEKRRPFSYDDLAGRARGQLGTLGSGNHFVEALRDHGTGRAWMMLHSGSRGVGSAICNIFHHFALAYCEQAGVALADPGLAYLPTEDDDAWAPIGLAYAVAMDAALRFAAASRLLMLEAVEVALVDVYGQDGRLHWDEQVNIHHNDAALEDHYGASCWVHRKGAVKAHEGASIVTPGSMGTGSFLSHGRGEASSFCSASHGAGRVMSRGQARRELILDDEVARLEASGGRVYVAGGAPSAHDEMPGSYKDLDTVMANQADLLAPLVHFEPLGTYKGADARTKRAKAKTSDERPPPEGRRQHPAAAGPLCPRCGDPAHGGSFGPAGVTVKGGGQRLLLGGHRVSAAHYAAQRDYVDGAHVWRITCQHPFHGLPQP